MNFNAICHTWAGFQKKLLFSLAAFFFLKFIYSEKVTKFCEIFPLLLTSVHTVKTKGKILQNFVAFSDYMNFIYLVNNSWWCQIICIQNWHRGITCKRIVGFVNEYLFVTTVWIFGFQSAFKKFETLFEPFGCKFQKG